HVTSLRSRLHARLDPHLGTCLATVAGILADRSDLDVLDVAAGTGWVRDLGVRSYHALDVVPPHEPWDIDTPLPAQHVSRYDLVLCLGALHFAIDPPRTVAEFVRALRPGGELVVSTPWIYPPHDREHDRWRISPLAARDLLAGSFEEVDLYLIGSALGLPLVVANRFVTGAFRGLPAEDLRRIVRRRRPAERIRTHGPADIPLRWFGPVGVVAHGRGQR
ncbi:MAG: class I SAM-dependent methyltransferase, partial [Nitriliruptorales bacterium]